MWILGLTGAIGAGKSTISCQFKSFGVPVHCADQEIHRLLKEDKDIKERVIKRWPGIKVGKDIDRTLLGDRVLENPQQLRELESILYPSLLQSQKSFLKQHKNIKTPIVVLDVPLLIEVGLHKYCHKTILVEAPFFIRRWRVLRRPRLPIKKLRKLESQQFSDDMRRKYADFIIATGRGKRSSLKTVKYVLETLGREKAPVFLGEWPKIIKKRAL